MSTDNSNEKHCDYNDFKRARYFDGELLNKQIFIAEQLYHNEKRKLLNRMLHGWGVVCGLKVKPTNPPGPNIIVEPGMALDCCGNEILVCEEQTVNLTVNPCRPKTDKFSCTEPDVVEKKLNVLYVVIKYQEVNTDPVPAYASSGNCGCEEKTCDYSRTREGFCIEVWDRLPPTPKPCIIDTACIEPLPCPPCCPDPHCIVLATISCGPRTDKLFSKCTINYFGDNEGAKQAEIRYRIKRSLPKVCTTGSDQITGINDIYAFETDRDFRNKNWEWSIDEEDLKAKGIIINFVSPSSGNSFEIDYSFTAPRNAEGIIYIEIPVSLRFFSDNNNLGSCCLILKSPIYIGTIEPKLGSIISSVMIRNTENRQYAITFPLVSWLTVPVLSSLLDSKEREKMQLSSGDLVNSFCKLIELSFFPEERREFRSRASSELEEKRIKEIVEKQFEDWKTEEFKKIESSIEEMKESAEKVKNISDEIKGIKAELAGKQNKKKEET